MPAPDELMQTSDVDQVLELMRRDQTAWTGERGQLAQVMALVHVTREMQTTVRHLDAAATRLQWAALVVAGGSLLVAIVALIVGT